MMEAVIKSSVILTITLGALPLLRRQSAAMRHAVLTVGFVCALCVPLVSPLLPSWHVAAISVGAGFSRGVPQSPSDAPMTAPAKAGAYADSFVPQRDVPSTSAIAFGIWLSGAGIAGIMILAGAARITWLAYRAVRPTERRWLAAVDDVSRALHLKR